MSQSIVLPSYSVPGKVFLLGEYAVLAGLPAIVATVPPRFVMKGGAAPQPHPDSPVGRLLHWARQTGLPEFSFQFQDPYQGAGGFGYSTAQFAMVYLALVQSAGLEARQWQDVWKLYRELMKDEKLKPSGADLIAQWQGGVTYFDPTEVLTMDLWALFDWSNLLIFSATQQVGRKVPTHHHLATLAGRGFPDQDLPFLSELEKVLRQGIQAIQEGEPVVLGKAMNCYAETLARAGLECEATRADRNSLSRFSGVLGVKGTGAMQSDAVIVLLRRNAEDREEVIRTAQDRGLNLVSEGLTCQMGVTCQYA